MPVKKTGPFLHVVQSYERTFEVEKGLHIIVDAVEEGGDPFKINVLAEDETKKVWD